MKIFSAVFGGLSVLTAVAIPASADELQARFDQAVLNADSVGNGSILEGAWGTYFGETLADELGVMQRQRPEYDPKGIPLGGFRLFPTLLLGGGYTDNVFYTPSPTKSDWLAEIQPAATLRSEWGRDSLVLYGEAHSTQYGSQSSQDTTDWDLGGSADFEITDAAHLRANTYYDAMHELRTSANFPGAVAEPIAFSLFHNDASGSYQAGRLGISLGASLDDYRYSDAKLIGGGTLSQSGRDENIYTVLGRATYEFSPDTAGFIAVSYEDRNFLDAVDLSGVNRGSKGVRANGGVEFVIGHLLEGQIFAGYLSQNFSSVALSDIHALNYGINANWYVTPLVTLHAGALRTIDDTTLFGASASNDQIAYLSLDYEFRRNVIAQGEVGYTDSEFVGIARHDKIPSAGLKLTWLLNHYMSADARYEFSHRNSSVAGQDYSNNQVLVELKFQI